MKFPKYKNSRRVGAKTILIMWSIFQSETNLNMKSCLEFRRRTGGERIAWTFNNFQLFFLSTVSTVTRVALESIVEALKWWITKKFNYARFLLFGGRAGAVGKNVISRCKSCELTILVGETTSFVIFRRQTTERPVIMPASPLLTIFADDKRHKRPTQSLI